MKNTERSSIVVLWDEVDDFLPTVYTVTWTNERDHIIQVRTLEEQSSYTITELTLDTVYTITVTATNRCGTGLEYSTSVSLITVNTSTISMTSTSTASTIDINTTTAVMIANSSTATIISSDATISDSAVTILSSAPYIIPLNPTTATVVMSPGAATNNPITNAVSAIADTPSSFTVMLVFRLPQVVQIPVLLPLLLLCHLHPWQIHLILQLMKLVSSQTLNTYNNYFYIYMYIQSNAL